MNSRGSTRRGGKWNGLGVFVEDRREVVAVNSWKRRRWF